MTEQRKAEQVFRAWRGCETCHTFIPSDECYTQRMLTGERLCLSCSLSACFLAGFWEDRKIWDTKTGRFVEPGQPWDDDD